LEGEDEWDNVEDLEFARLHQEKVELILKEQLSEKENHTQKKKKREDELRETLLVHLVCLIRGK
jgi:hypothetical protein